MCRTIKWSCYPYQVGNNQCALNLLSALYESDDDAVMKYNRSQLFTILDTVMLCLPILCLCELMGSFIVS